MSSQLLVTEGLTKRYGGLVANDAVAISINRGEIRGLIGPNGAGKTTLVNLISGIETPDAGDIWLANTRLTGLAPHAIAHHGLVRSFQVARVFSNLTVRENLLVPYLASRRGTSIADGLARAADLLRLATLARLADAPANTLSGGQRMLLQACAGFMIPGVELYVLDEPFAGINPVVKDTLTALIMHENRVLDISFLIVSHEMEIVRRLCPCVTVMISGTVAAEGTLEDVAQREDVIKAYLGQAML
jgi:branched-chain amino acid transport system ATP-binding protein